MSWCRPGRLKSWKLHTGHTSGAMHAPQAAILQSCDELCFIDSRSFGVVALSLSVFYRGWRCLGTHKVQVVEAQENIFGQFPNCTHSLFRLPCLRSLQVEEGSHPHEQTETKKSNSINDICNFAVLLTEHTLFCLPCSRLHFSGWDFGILEIDEQWLHDM